MVFEEMVRAAKRLSRVMIPLRGDNLELKVAWIRASHTPYSSYSSRYKPHSHAMFEMHATLEGYQDYGFENGDTLRVGAGEMVLIAPGQNHQCTEESEDCRSISICFQIIRNGNGEALSEDGRYLQHFLYLKPCALLKQSNSFRNTIDRIFDEAIGQRPGYLTLLRACILQMMFDIARQIESAEKIRSFQTALAEKGHSEARVEEAEQFIFQNIADGITCERVAEHLHMSTKQLDRVIRAETGGSLHEMIVKAKHDKAQELLLETDLTIREISEALGYSSEYNFNRFFSKVEGMSPGRFRHARHFAISVSRREM